MPKYRRVITPISATPHFKDFGLLVKCKFQMDRRLTRKRNLLVDLQTVTFWTQADQDDESDPERPVVGPGGILDFIRRHQAREHKDLDPEVVMDAVMFMGRYEW